MENIIRIKNSIIEISEKIIENNLSYEEALEKLTLILKKVKSLQYDNCTVEKFEALLDEELLLDLIINKRSIDIETVEEVVMNKEAYLVNSYTFSKLVDDILK